MLAGVGSVCTLRVTGEPHELQGTEFPTFVRELEACWQCVQQPNDGRRQVPVFLDLLSGPVVL